MDQSIDLAGLIPNVGSVSFLRAEWWNQRFVVIRYSVAGKESVNGWRLDMSKKAFLDGNDSAVRAMAEKVWDVVIQKWSERAVEYQLAMLRDIIAASRLDSKFDEHQAYVRLLESEQKLFPNVRPLI